jgi:hypothetical protein
MKYIFTLLTLFNFSSLFAVDRFVNPNLSSGNGTTLFTNITSAITAAVNGDRIIVASNTYNEAALTIGKSLQIMPQTPGTTINFNANITIAGFPGMKFEITGFNLGIYSFNSSPIVSGSYTNRAKITIIDCNVTNIDFNKEFYESNVIKNTIVGNLTFKFGNIVSNNIQSCYLWDENSINQDPQQKILIVNNQITGVLLLFNDDYKYTVANNTLNTFILKRWSPSNIIKNKIINNDFIANSQINISYINVPNYNIVFSSNKFLGSYTVLSNNSCQSSNNCAYFNAIADYNSESTSLSTCCGNLYNGSTSIFPNTSVSGFFEWTYNGINPININTDSNSPLVLTKIDGQVNSIDGGNPNHDYYDINLTINDRGINGGPYSQLNYNAANPNNSKAFMFDLDMPSDLFPSQNVQIKAKGYHKN